MILLSGKISLWMFVLRDDGNVDRRRWATVLSSFMDIMIFLIYREWFSKGWGILLIRDEICEVLVIGFGFERIVDYY